MLFCWFHFTLLFLAPNAAPKMCGDSLPKLILKYSQKFQMQQAASVMGVEKFQNIISAKWFGEYPKHIAAQMLRYKCAKAPVAKQFGAAL